MNNLPKEVIKLRDDLERQREKMLVEGEMDLFEKRIRYNLFELINPYAEIYHQLQG